MEVYKGSLSSLKLKGEALRAWDIWSCQRQRCNNKNVPQYKGYGGKGLRVEYSSREFIGWWLHNIKQKKWKKPSCGRIDHNKGYSLDNIQMEELSDNVKEMLERNGIPSGLPQKRKVVLLDDNGNEAIIFESVQSVVKNLKVHNVEQVCKGKRPRAGGFVFRYYQGG